MKFYNREEELALLEKAYARSGADLIIVSGRRRVGKSRLVDEFLKGKKAVSIMVMPKEEKQVAHDLEEEIRAKYGYSPSFGSLREALEYAFEQNFGLIFMDEFPNVLQVNSAVPFEVQRLWDAYKDKKDVLLIFSGSYAGMMNRLFAAKKAPLFNRATSTISLQPLLFKTVSQILTELGVSEPADKIAFFLVFGGIPYYYVLLEKEGAKSFEAAVEALFFGPGAQLREEGESILKQEFGGVYSKYYAILEAIGSGSVSMNEITSKLGIRATTLSKYVKALQQDFKLVERMVPFGQNPLKSKKGQYFMADNTLSFWFPHVHGKRNPPTEGEACAFLGRRFEFFCRRFFEGHLEGRGERIIRLGKWWGAVEKEKGKFEQRDIDLVVETDKAFYFGECKWSNKKMGKPALALLSETASAAFPGVKKPVKFALFSKSGFSLPEEKGLLLFDAKGLAEA